jgi:glutathione S-transferase
MKLFYTKAACSLIVRIIINEIGLTCEYEAVDLATKKSASGQDYLKINPKGAVPALMINGGEILTENSAIIQYLADTHHKTSLLPVVGDLKRYRVIEWLNFMATDLHKNFGPMFNPALPQEIKDKFFIPLLKAKLTYVDKHLHHHHYLSGDDFTLADAYFFVMLTWALHFQFNLADWPQISRYFAELKERKSIEKSLKEEGLQ